MNTKQVSRSIHKHNKVKNSKFTQKHRAPTLFGESIFPYSCENLVFAGIFLIQLGIIRDVGRKKLLKV